MWIALIKREHGRFDACAHLIERAQRGEIEIWTSAFTYAEVYKKNCSGTQASIDAVDDKSFEDYIEQEFVQLVQVDADVGRVARRLLRQYPGIGKPQDAVHVASAVLMDVHELHTFDRRDLLALDEKLKCLDGTPLRIKIPPTPPDLDAGTLFEGLNIEDSGKKAR